MKILQERMINGLGKEELLLSKIWWS